MSLSGGPLGTPASRVEPLAYPLYPFTLSPPWATSETFAPNTACNAVLESYRNGQQSAQAAHKPRPERTNGKGARPKPPRQS